MDKTVDKRFEVAPKILHIGPDIEGKGGMAEVLRLHKNHVFKDLQYNYMRSNSRRGSIFGIANLVGLLFRLPFYRLKGKEIVHIHITVGKSFYRKNLISAFSKMLGYKIILHWHGGKAQDFLKHIVNRNFFSLMLRYSDRLIVLSPRWEKFFSSIIDKKKIFIVPNPVLLSTQRNPMISSEVKMLFLGRFRREKGVYDLIEACNNLEKDGIDVKLTLCGDGEVKKVKNLISKNGLEHRIQLFNWVEGKEKELIIRNSNIIVLPSYAEASPMSLLEGMGNRLAVISSKVGGIPDLIHSYENGILIDPGSINQLEEAIKYYVFHPEKISEHGDKSFEKIRNYCIPVVRERLLGIYAQLAE